MWELPFLYRIQPFLVIALFVLAFGLHRPYVSYSPSMDPNSPLYSIGPPTLTSPPAASITTEEQREMMVSLRQATKNTNFGLWLGAANCLAELPQEHLSGVGGEGGSACVTPPAHSKPTATPSQGEYIAIFLSINLAKCALRKEFLSGS